MGKQIKATDVGNTNRTNSENKNDSFLIEMSHNAGAMDAVVISAKDIIIEDRLAKFCKDPGCENYGLSMSCPPHVEGPDGFRKLLTNCNKAIAFKIDVPYHILFSNERNEWFRLLHEIASEIEHGAVKMGYKNSRAFAGGSCKQIFCDQYIDCEVIARKGECRNPLHARPSMSGFGINVKKLMKTAGFEMDDSKTQPNNKPTTGILSGLVLIC